MAVGTPKTAPDWFICVCPMPTEYSITILGIAKFQAELLGFQCRKWAPFPRQRKTTSPDDRRRPEVHVLKTFLGEQSFDQSKTLQCCQRPDRCCLYGRFNAHSIIDTRLDHARRPPVTRPSERSVSPRHPRSLCCGLHVPLAPPPCRRIARLATVLLRKVVAAAGKASPHRENCSRSSRGRGKPRCSQDELVLPWPAQSWTKRHARTAAASDWRISCFLALHSAGKQCGMAGALPHTAPAITGVSGQVRLVARYPTSKGLIKPNSDDGP